MTTSSPHVSHLPYINTITTGLLYNCFLKIYFDYAITVVPIFLLSPFTMYPPFPLEIPPLSLCPWVVHKSSLASPFPTLFLTSPCLFCTYQLCFLFPVPFPSLPPPKWLPSKWSSYLRFCFYSASLLSKLVWIQLLIVVTLLPLKCSYSFFFFFLDKSLQTFI